MRLKMFCMNRGCGLRNSFTGGGGGGKGKKWEGQSHTESAVSCKYSLIIIYSVSISGHVVSDAQTRAEENTYGNQKFMQIQ